MRQGTEAAKASAENVIKDIRRSSYGDQLQCRAMRVRRRCWTGRASLIQEVGERRPAFKAVVDRLGGIALAGDPVPLLAQIGLQGALSRE